MSGKAALQRVHHLPHTDDPSWKEAGAVNLLVMFVGDSESPMCVSKKAAVDALSPRAHALLDIRCAAAIANATLAKKFDALAQVNGQETADITKARSETLAAIRALAATNAGFHIAVEARRANPTGTIASAIAHTLLQMYTVGSLWQNLHLIGDLSTLVDATVEHDKWLHELIKRSTAAAPYMSDIYEALIQDQAAQRPLPRQLDTTLFAKRGRAAGDAWSAMRGWFIRTIDRALPPFEIARYAVIAELLCIAGVDGTSPALVRAVLKKGRT